MNAWVKRWEMLGEKIEATLERLEDKVLTEKNLIWFDAFVKSSAVSLVLISFVWVGLELFLEGTRSESGIDTIIAFIAAFGIGYFFAQNKVKKEKIKQLTQTIAKQNRVMAEQTDTLKKVWAIKKPRQ